MTDRVQGASSLSLSEPGVSAARPSTFIALAQFSEHNAVCEQSWFAKQTNSCLERSNFFRPGLQGALTDKEVSGIGTTQTIRRWGFTEKLSKPRITESQWAIFG